MAYDAITPGEADANSPADATLWGKVKDNFDDHETRIASNEGELGDYTVGDYALYAHPESALNLTLSNVKEQEMRVNRAGTYRVRFGLYNDSTGTCYGRIYKNGSALGTARSNTVDGTTVYFSEDFTFAVGDLIQIYAYASNLTTDQLRNFEIFVSTPIAGRNLNY